MSSEGDTPAANSSLDPEIVARAWVKTLDPSSGRHYYANLITEAVSWVEPEGYQPPDPSGWIELQHPTTQRVYYYNVNTAETNWTRPDGFGGGGETAGMSPVTRRSTVSEPQHSESGYSNGKDEQDAHRRRGSSCLTAFSEDDSSSSESGSEGGDASSDSDPEDDGVDLMAINKPTATISNASIDSISLSPATLALFAAAQSQPPLPSTTPQQQTPLTPSSPVLSTLSRQPSLPPPRASVVDQYLPPSAAATSPIATPMHARSPASSVSSSSSSSSYYAPPPPPPTGHDSEFERSLRGMGSQSQKFTTPRFARQDSRTSPYVKGEEVEEEIVGGLYRIPTVIMESIEKLQLEGFAITHFKEHKKGILRKKVPIPDMLKFTKEPITSSLLKLPKGNGKLAAKMFSKILAYMGDRTARCKDVGRIAQRILAIPFRSPLLKDELFCQIAKQCTHNNKVDSLVRGWELMALSLGIFLPSRELLVPYEKFIWTGIAHANPQIPPIASNCKARLDKSLGTSPRKMPPSVAEIEAVKMRKAIPVRIHLMDGTFKGLLIESSTTGFTACRRMGQKSQLLEEFVPMLAIFESRGGNHMRCLEESEHLCDVMAAWEAASRGAENNCKFFCRVRLLTDKVINATDPTLIQLQYVQAVHAVLSGFYPVTEQEVVKLGAMQLMNDFNTHDHTPGSLSSPQQLAKYVPEFIIKNKSPQTWETELFNLHAKLRDSENHYTSMEMKTSYLNFLSTKFEYHSSAFYHVQEVDKKTDERNNVILAVNRERIFLLHPTTKQIISKYSFSDICTLEQTPETFTFVLGSLNDKKNQRPHRYITPVGVEICSLAQDYMRVWMDDQQKFTGTFHSKP